MRVYIPWAVVMSAAILGQAVFVINKVGTDLPTMVIIVLTFISVISAGLATDEHHQHEYNKQKQEKSGE